MHHHGARGKPVALKQRPSPEFLRSDRKVAWTYLVLAWEGWLAAFWPLTLTIMIGLALGLSDLLPLLPSLLHATVIAVGAIAVLASLGWGIYRFRRPQRFDAERRLEIDNDLPHRPLTTALDHLALGADDSFATTLWAAHRRRTLSALALMRLPFPRPVLPLGDPRALRALVGILLGLAVIASWGEMGPRLKRAISPSLFNGGASEIAQLDLWINPPDYTSLPPVFLKSTPDTQSTTPMVTVPVGSKITARFSGRGTAPVMDFAGTDFTFDAIPGRQNTNQQSFTKEMILEKSGEVSIYQGRKKLLSFNLEVTPDTPPGVGFTAPPSTTPRSALKLDWHGKDDFGLSNAKIRVWLAPDKNPADGKNISAESDALVLPLILPSDNPTTVVGESFQDLTAHEWAGLKVQVQIIAVDALGQEGRSDVVTTTLPVRKFNNPVAQALVDQRRDLARDETLVEEAADILDQLVIRPQLYYDDPVVFLGMRVASVRLRHMDVLEADALKQELAEVRSLLWDLALRIEDGSMPLAMQDLRVAQDALQSALNRNAPDAEIEHLIEQLQQALQQYMKALMEEAARRLAEGAELQPVDPSQTMDMRDIQSMMDSLRDMARSGAKDKAKQILSQMRDLLERLQAAPSLAFDPRRQSGAESMMRDMQDLAERQQQLMDKTFQGMNGEPQPGQGQPGQGQPSQGQQGQPGESPGRQPGQGQSGQGQPGQFGNPTPGQLGQMQQYLRERLGDIVRRMGEGGAEIPGAFGKADQAMRDAADALGRGNTGEAVDPQGQALDQLRQGMQAAREAMQQQQEGRGQNPGQQPGGNNGDPRAGAPQDGRDPLGRPLSGQAGVNNSDVVIPEEGELQRSREILDELRRRAGESHRVPLERDYIDRLLRQF